MKLDALFTPGDTVTKPMSRSSSLQSSVVVELDVHAQPDISGLKSPYGAGTALDVLGALAPERLRLGESTSRIALRCILDILRERRASPSPVRRLSGVAFMTGHLGAGGAELQMSRTVEMVAAAAGGRQKIAGVTLAHPIYVVVNSLRADADRPLNFFQPRLTRKNIPVLSMTDFPAVGLDERLTEDARIHALMPLLYPNIRRGLRLVPWFRDRNIQVAYIWQDGSILQFALAALLAGVPRVVVNFRSLPPVLRWKEHLPEYEELYFALANMPGVTFVCNSSKAADAYSSWTGCSREAFHVIFNGADLHSSHPSKNELKAWMDFDEKTKGATITIGGIFRMHPNKRPLEWIRFARSYLINDPKARFILIGKGMLFRAVSELARTLGLAGRLLMIPQTKAGAFWLKKMDVFVLLSRYEGTPNVLIEAQLAGVPVVCTPIANATDTFVDGLTGLATSSAAVIDIEDVISKVDRIVSLARAGEDVYRFAQRHIAARYSTRAMIEHTVRVLSARDKVCCIRQPERTADSNLAENWT